MLYIKSLEQAVPVFKALGSDIRIRLIQTLLEHQEMNMNELASSLGITNGALTSHVKKLEEAGILAILPEHSGHGNQKVCRINVDKILVDIASNNDSPAEDSYSIDIPIGNYFNYSVYPTSIFTVRMFSAFLSNASTRIVRFGSSVGNTTLGCSAPSADFMIFPLVVTIFLSCTGTGCPFMVSSRILHTQAHMAGSSRK